VSASVYYSKGQIKGAEKKDQKELEKELSPFSGKVEKDGRE